MVMNEDPRVQDRKDAALCLGVMGIALSPLIALTMDYVSRGHYGSAAFIGLMTAAPVVYASLSALSIKEEEQADRIAWKLYQDHLGNDKK